MTTRILVPTDFSHAATRALEYASRLADALKAELLVLHVVPPGTTRPWEEQTAGDHIDALAEAWVSDARVTLTQAIDAIAGTKADVRGTVRLGLEADEILNVARDQRIDLIVMGRHGHGRTLRWLRGSVTDRVLRRASCPVVAIPGVPNPRETDDQGAACHPVHSPRPPESWPVQSIADCQ